MRAVIQRAGSASLTIYDNQPVTMGPGLVVLVGIETSDDQSDSKWLSSKISRLRIFDDEEGMMNLSLSETGGDVMIVSQFTLFASTRKGNRPSHIRAAPPGLALPLYEHFIRCMEHDLGRKAVTGEFRAHMQVALVNEGPVTIVIDTKNRE